MVEFTPTAPGVGVYKTVRLDELGEYTQGGQWALVAIVTSSMPIETQERLPPDATRNWELTRTVTTVAPVAVAVLVRTHESQLEETQTLLRESLTREEAAREHARKLEDTVRFQARELSEAHAHAGGQKNSIETLTRASGETHAALRKLERDLAKVRTAIGAREMEKILADEGKS